MVLPLNLRVPAMASVDPLLFLCPAAIGRLDGGAVLTSYSYGFHPIPPSQSCWLRSHRT